MSDTGPAERSERDLQSLIVAHPFVFVAVAFLIGVALSFASLETLVTTNSRWLFAGLGIGALAAFTLASWFSEEAEETHPPGRMANLLHWFTMSVIALVVVMILGVVALFVLGWAGIRFVPSHFSWWALLADLVLGAAAGAGTALLTGAVGGTLSVANRAARRVMSAPPPRLRERPDATFAAVVLRYSLVSLTGMTVSVGLQALAYRFGWSADLTSLYLPVAGWFIGCALAWWAPQIAAVAGRLAGAHSSERPKPRPVAHHHHTRNVVHGLGFVLFVLVVAGLFATSVFGAANSATKQLWEGAAPIGTVSPECAPSGGAYTLAARYCPALRFEAKEQWRPTSVTWFEGHGTSTNGCASGCYQLTCDTASPSRSCAPEGISNPNIYVRVTRGSSANDWPATDSTMPKAFNHGWVLLQYWFFYNYDSLGTMPGVWQWHQADWEQLTVGLAGTGAEAKPVFAAYSEHCVGTRLPWHLVGRVDQTHPLVFVARGSHANYPRLIDAPLRAVGCAHEFAAPPYFGSAGLLYAVAGHGGDLEVPFDYAFDVRDRTGAIVQHSQFTLRLLHPGDGIEDYPGTWGLDNQISGFGQPWLKGSAPRSPGAQSSWQAPGAAVLCSDRWFHPTPIGEGRICRAPRMMP